MKFVVVAILSVTLGVQSFPSTGRVDNSDKSIQLDIMDRVTICAFKAKQMEEQCAKQSLIKCTPEATSFYIKCIAGSIENLELVSAEVTNKKQNKNNERSETKNDRKQNKTDANLNKRFANFREFKTNLQAALDRVTKCSNEVKILTNRYGKDVPRMNQSDAVNYFLDCIGNSAEKETKSATDRNQIIKNKFKRSSGIFNDISTYDSADSYYDSESGCLDDEFDPERLQKAERFDPQLLKPRKHKRSLTPNNKLSKNSIDVNNVISNVENDPKKCIANLVVDIIKCFSKTTGKDNIEECLVIALTKFITSLKKY